MGDPVRFYVSVRAAEGRKISIFFLTFGDGEWFESDPMAVTSIDRQEIVHVYTLPDGEDGWNFEATLTVYDNAMNSDEDTVGISVKRGAD
jgi:hypothetical protein